MTREAGKKTSEKVRGLRWHRLTMAAQLGSIERAQVESGCESRFGAGQETREVSRAASAGETDTKSGCLVRGRAPSKPGGKVALLARESKADGRRKADGRSWRSSNGAASRRCSRVTTALRGRVDFRMALPGVYALVRHGAKGRHPRRGAPKSGAGVATKKAFALSSREVVAGREARNHGVHRIDSY